MTRRILAGRALLAITLLGASGSRVAARDEFRLPDYPRTVTRYYMVYSRLDRDTLREADARLTAMAREYHRRTSGFRKSIKQRLPEQDSNFRLDAAACTW